MNTSRLSIIGGSVIIVLVLLLGYLLGISPKLTEASTAISQQQQVDTQNAAQQAQVVILRDKFSKINVLRAEYAALQTEMPSAPNSPDFVDQVKSLADAAGASILSITLGEPQVLVAAVPVAEAKSAGTSTTAAAVAAAKDAKMLAGNLYYSTVAISARGNSTQVFNFLSALQEGKRLFLADNVIVTAGGVQPGATISGSVLVVPATTGAVKPAGK